MSYKKDYRLIKTHILSDSFLEKYFKDNNVRLGGNLSTKILSKCNKENGIPHTLYEYEIQKEKRTDEIMKELDLNNFVSEQAVKILCIFIHPKPKQLLIVCACNGFLLFIDPTSKEELYTGARLGNAKYPKGTHVLSEIKL